VSAARRKALIEFARARGAVIIEDDYDGEFRYEGSFVEALRTAEAADVVFYVGTFSKCMLPSFRLGYVVAPDWAIRTLVAAKNCLDWHCPIPIQMSVAGFIAGGHLARHVRKMRQIYRKRRRFLIHELEREFAEWLEPIPSFYGMHVAARLRVERSLDSVVASLLDSRIKIHTFDRYRLGAAREQGLIFGYGAADLPELGEGLMALRKALASA
jgi:GntR family transcriptional regulator / MocR family aminotransferase